MPSLFDWSATDSSNTAVDGVNINTGMSPANVDNALRKIMAGVRASVASVLQNFLAGSAALPIANGGTSATTATGALSALGGLSSAYQFVPINVVSTAIVPGAGTSGQGYDCYSGSSIALDPNSTTARTTGSSYVIRNGQSSGSLTITPGVGVSLSKNGGAPSNSAAILAPYAVVSLTYWGTDFWHINGPGIS